MRLIKKLLKVLAILVGLIVIALGAVVYASFSGNLPIADGQRANGVEVVKDGIVSSFIVDVDAQSVLLVDAGNDREAKPIVAALARRQLGPGAVRAILLTHGDRDHTAGVLAFPRAEVMALEPDVGLVEGREARGVFKMAGKTTPNGIKVARALKDGETVTVGEVAIRVFAVPGHTKGSAAFVARNTLFMGDSAEATKESKLAPGKRLFTESPAQNRASLRALAARLAPMAGDIKVIAPSHSGMLVAGLAPLTDFAASAK
jgi:glyoxylase-like metal-dependent hydrolase (beta-lactamase superfamily II)